MKQDLFAYLKSIIIPFFALIFSFFITIYPLILLVGLFILLDTVTGIYKSYKLGIKITSKGLKSLIIKMLIYQTTVLTFFMIEVYVLKEIVIMFIDIPCFLTKIVAMSLIFIEIISIDENIKEITGKSLLRSFRDLVKSAKKLKTDFNKMR